MSCAIDDTWGKDTENWKDICVFENMMNVIARASNRVFVGLPLCRDPAYLKSMGGFAQDVMNTILFMRFTPKILEPILGRLFTLPNQIHYWRSASKHMPLIKERLRLMQQKADDPSFDWEPPNDYLTWHIEQAHKDGNMRELQPEMIGRRLMPINFAAIHTTVFTITNCLFDLASSPEFQPSVTSTKSMHPFEGIREEAEGVYDGVWDKQKLALLVRGDSAVRESMRVSTFLTRGLQRKVVSPNGLEHPSQGYKAAYGTIIGMDVYSVMRDPLIYNDPNNFHAFRFVQLREEEENATNSESNGHVDSTTANGKAAGNGHVEKDTKSSSAMGSKNLGISSTSGTFLPFGHGRHAW